MEVQSRLTVASVVPVQTWALTRRTQFDSYLTVNTLQPGQFEKIAKALADPRRFALLEAISAGGECPQARLCSVFPVTKATISHHLKELAQAGLVEPERDGQFMNYRVCREVLKAYSDQLMRRVGATTTV